VRDGRADHEENAENHKRVGQGVVLAEPEEDADDITRDARDEKKDPSLHDPKLKRRQGTGRAEVRRFSGMPVNRVGKSRQQIGLGFSSKLEHCITSFRHDMGLAVSAHGISASSSRAGGRAVSLIRGGSGSGGSGGSGERSHNSAGRSALGVAASVGAKPKAHAFQE
jgi:hypothetical protein